MTDEKTTKPPSLRDYLVGSLVVGSIVGSLFSGADGGDLDFPKDFNLTALYGTLSFIALFGLPAGLLLGVVENIRGKRHWWVAVIEVPSLLIGGFVLIFGVLSIPFGINGVARVGSEWLTGGANNPMLRRVIGGLFGTCAVLVLFGFLKVVTSVQATWRIWISPRREEK